MGGGKVQQAPAPVYMTQSQYNAQYGGSGAATMPATIQTNRPSGTIVKPAQQSRISFTLGDMKAGDAQGPAGELGKSVDYSADKAAGRGQALGSGQAMDRSKGVSLGDSVTKGMLDDQEDDGWF